MAWGIYLRLGGCVSGLWDHDVGWDYFSCSYGLFLPLSLAGRTPVRVGSLWSVHGPCRPSISFFQCEELYLCCCMIIMFVDYLFAYGDELITSIYFRKQEAHALEKASYLKCH